MRKGGEETKDNRQGRRDEGEEMRERRGGGAEAAAAGERTRRSICLTEQAGVRDILEGFAKTVIRGRWERGRLGKGEGKGD